MSIWVDVLSIVIATAVVWKASEILEDTSERLSSYYGLSPAVRGSVIVAVGSSFPELSSVVISTLLHQDFSLGVGAIVGSAIFNILVIPSLSGLSRDGALPSTRDIVYKDAQFYIISILVLFVVFALGATYTQTGSPTNATITSTMALLPLLTYGIYIFFQYQDSREADIETVESVSALKQFALLAVSLVLIVGAIELMVRGVLGLGETINAPSFLWGAIVIAAGTSIPDAFVSVRTAEESATTSLTNAIGSNIFDLLVAIPVGVILAGTATVNYVLSVPMFGFLGFSTLLFVVFTRTSLEIADREAYIMILTYVVFVIWLVLETLDILNILGQSV